MQMKLFIIAILAGTLLAVSPSAVGQHYDDTIHNNLSIDMRKLETDADVFSTNPVIAPLAKSQIMKLCLDNMQQEDFHQAKAQLSQVIDLAKKSDSHTTFHAFIANMSYKAGEARTYELTVVRNEKSLVGVLTKKTHIVDVQAKKNSFYFEIYSSVFGLPFRMIQSTNSTDLKKDMIEYMRQYLLRAAEQARKTSMHAEGQLKTFVVWAQAAAQAIQALTKAAQGIINTFKTVKTTTLKHYYKGKGFKAYKASSTYSRILGVPTSKYDLFLKAYKVQMGIDQSPRIKEIDAYFTIAEFASNEWKMNDFVFGIGQKNNICNNLVITNKINYTDNVVHFVSVNVNGSFELADDTLIYTQYKSVFGGISETTKDVIKHVPRDITSAEIKAINALMVLNAINVYTDNMNIKFSLPNDDPWKM